MNLTKFVVFTAFLGLLALLPKSAMAQEANYSKGHSTWTVTGVNCSTGTVGARIVISTVGFTTSGIRITNQDPTYAVWLGPRIDVSSKTAFGDSVTNRGEKLAAGASGVWELGYDMRGQIRPTIFCIAADAAGGATVPLSVAIFGY